MPVSTNAVIQPILDPALPQSVQQKLNNRLRQIEQLIGSGGTVSTSSTTQTSGGVSEVVLVVPGILGVQSNAAPALMLGQATSFSTVVLLLKEAPQGGPLTAQLYVGGTAWGPALSISGTSATASAGAVIGANQLIRLDITGVPQTFPGSDLTAILR